MKRLALIVLVAVSCFTVLLAAPVDRHIRGRIDSISSDTLVIRTPNAGVVSVRLAPGTHYLRVVRSSLDKVEPGSYIGTATKDIGSTQVALEIMIFPPQMRGLNAGHFPYDRLPDTTLGRAETTASMMTNGNVAAVSVPAHALVSTTMTNGAVTAGTRRDGVKELTITYPNGRQIVLVPPTAPIVDLRPETLSNLATGAFVFVDATKDGESLIANLVAAGSGGLKPPF
jgi:hypothetical protein